jgi:hypothetical protein
MKAQAITTIVLLTGVAIYFGYWAAQFLAINPTCFESIMFSAGTLASVMAIREQYRNYQRKCKSKKS